MALATVLLVVGAQVDSTSSCLVQLGSQEWQCIPAQFGLASEEVVVIKKSLRTPDSKDNCCDENRCHFEEGSIALVERGGCGFIDKCRNAERMGASAVIVFNNDEAPPFPMGAPSQESLSLPVMMVSQSAGAGILAGMIQGTEPALVTYHRSESEFTYRPFVVEQKPSPFQLNPSICVESQVPSLSAPFHIYVHDPQHCRFISKNLVETGRWEETITNRILEIMGNQKDGLFVDVGANVGWFTLLVAAMGHSVIAIEPMLYNIELLEASIRKSGLEALIAVHKSAVGENKAESSEKAMCVLPAFDGDPTANTGNGQLHKLTPENQARCTDIIRASALDVLLGNVTQRIRAVKLDIEGFETLALRGSRELLASPSPPCHIIIEYWQKYVEWTGVGQYELFEVLWGHGYTSFTLSGSQQEQVTADDLATIKDGDYEFRHNSCSTTSV